MPSSALLATVGRPYAYAQQQPPYLNFYETMSGLNGRREKREREKTPWSAIKEADLYVWLSGAYHVVAPSYGFTIWLIMVNTQSGFEMRRRV